MKIDTRINSHKNVAFLIGCKLNGELLSNAIMADEEKGIVLVNAKDENGNFIEDGDAWKTELLHGKVELFIMDKSHA